MNGDPAKKFRRAIAPGKRFLFHRQFLIRAGILSGIGGMPAAIRFIIGSSGTSVCVTGCPGLRERG